MAEAKAAEAAAAKKAAAEQAEAQAKAEKKAAEAKAAADAAAQKAAAAQARAEKQAAEKAAQERAIQEAKAAAERAKIAQGNEVKAASAPYPGKELGFPPIQAPPLPYSADKQAQLDALLVKYQADQISPEEYHKQRAAILAQP